MRSSLLSIASIFMVGVACTESPIPGYGVETFSWDVQVPDGSTVVLNGTVEEVYTQLLDLHPDLDLSPNTAVNKRTDLKLGKRDSVTCGNWPLANKAAIQNGITYLRGVAGAPRNGPGPGNCGRVSCSTNNAIWWCNDNTVAKTLDSWNNVADGAQLIINTCAPSADSVSGQNFHDDLWNVIVRNSAC